MSDIMALTEEYNKIKNSGKKLDMSRGKPSPAQLDIAEKMLTVLSASSDCIAENGIDCRNYGVLGGIPEVRRLFAEILDVPEKNVLMGGNSSLNMMYDLISKAFTTGLRGNEPWYKSHVKFLCPSPGYDRHFGVTEHFGIGLILVPMYADGPDMDAVEEYVKDPAVKGIWNVPKYSNPTGVTYSDETVRRFAKLKPAAPDFCIIWDNAYCVHHLTDTPDTLLNIFTEAAKYGTEDMIYEYASTSKVTFSGAGVSCVIASDANIKELSDDMKVRTIGNDKLNMLRHARFLAPEGKLEEVMREHRSILEPKFELCYKRFGEQLSDIPGVSWTHPNGGYFITLYTPNGTAKHVVGLAKEAGLVVTPAGSGFPYNVDPDDRTIRIAPSYPDLDELDAALHLLCICVKLAAACK